MRRGLVEIGFCVVLVATVHAAVLTARPPAPEAAGELPRPRGEVVLTVTGDIARTNSSAGAEFDLAMLEELGTTTLHTATPWTEGEPTFEGVLAREVLELVGARGTTVEAVALNDYVFEIESSDFQDYPVILADRMNGVPLTARDKGPLWIVYPLDEFSGREKQAIELRMVWQLVELNVK